MKVAIQTLGCKVNQSESASIEGILRNNNFEIVEHTDRPDVCIINTCTVTAKSDYQSRQLIRKATRTGARVIATGCYAQLRADEMSTIEGLNLIIGNSEKNNIINYIHKLKMSNGGPSTEVYPPENSLRAQPYYSDRSRAFLKIQDGCNFSCSYCTVPMARGRGRSLSGDDIMKSVEKLCLDGYQEIVLTGIHIGSYGIELNPKSSLLKAVRRISEFYPQIRIRLSSIEPQEFDNELLLLMKSGNVCPHLHIPLQSGSDKILKAMSRGYTADFFEHLINNLITGYPEMSIGTDVIAGFPGETDKNFNDTVKFIETLPLSYLHVFPYSGRPNTKASALKDQVSVKVKKNRVQKLIELGKTKKNNYMKKNLGRILDVIVEKGNVTDDYYNALSDNYLRIFVKSRNLHPGQRLRVKVSSLTDKGLIAKPPD